MKLSEKTQNLLLIIFILAIIMYMICTDNTKSSFGGLDTNNSTSIPLSITDDSVLIIYAPWCGHCTRSMPEFEKAVKSGDGKVIMIDATKQDNIEIIKKYDVKGYPTIIKGDGTKYNKTSRSADDIISFVKNEE